MTKTNVTPVAHKLPLVVLREKLEARKEELGKALVDISPDHFIRTLITAATLDPNLQACSWNSLWMACLRACRDQLLPDGREGVIVSFKDKATWIPMYQGLLKRFRQSGECKWITANVVRKGEKFEHYIDQSGVHFHHIPDGSEKDPIIKVYAAALTKDEAFYCAVMSMSEIEEIKKESRANRPDSPWQKWSGEMMKKTALRRLAKLLPAGRDIFEDEDSSSLESGAVSGVAKAETESEAETERLPGAAAALETFAGPTPVPSGAVSGVAIAKPESEAETDDEGLEPVDYGEYADSDDELPLGEKDQAHDRASG
jgi:recombination protein RecT